MTRGIWTIAAAGLAVVAASLALAARRVGPPVVAVAHQREVPEASMLPWVTPAAVTPTAPVTPTMHADWYPTSEPYFQNPSALARQAAFAPGGFDLAFTLNKAAEGCAPDVYLAEADADGALSGRIAPLVGLPEGAAAVAVKTSEAAGRYAIGATVAGPASVNARYDGVWLLDAPGRKLVRLDDRDVGWSDFWWLPDGSGLSLLDAHGRLWLHDLDSGEQTVLSEALLVPSGAAAAQVAWSPDSSTAALGRFDANGGGFVETVDRVTASVRFRTRLPESGMPLPVFTCDGTGLLVFATDAGNTSAAKLYRIESGSGGAAIEIADLGNANGRSAWVGSAVCNPFEPWVYYVQDGAIKRVGVDGTDGGDVVPRGAEVVRGDLMLRSSQDGRVRLGYVASRYVAALSGTTTAIGVATDGASRQPLSTILTVRSVEIKDDAGR